MEKGLMKYKNPHGSKTYCTKAFTNVFTDGANRYRLCADAGITPEIKDMNIETTLPLDFYYSEGMDKETWKKARALSDKIFLLGMQSAEPKVPKFKIHSAYYSVRMFGRWPASANPKEK